ncbi:MAG: diguanylate cyclase [Phycisphaerales bacterium]|nr:diguanylate cyclase [Phycisphaerales bacterium]
MESTVTNPPGATAEPSVWARLRQTVCGLQMRFTAMVVGLALLVGATVGMVTFDLTARLIRRVHAEQCREAAEMLARRAATLYEHDQAALRELASDLVASEPLVFVAFMSPNGSNMAAARNAHYADVRLTVGLTPQTALGQPMFVEPGHGVSGFLDVTYPVQGRVDPANPGSTPALLGYVRIGHSLQRTLSEVQATVEFLSGIAVLITALTVPLGFLVVRRMVRPLHDLAATMSRFATGDLGARSRLVRHDELGDLARAYNHMADRLSQKHVEISQLNAELEERVQQRTRQLRELAMRDALTGLYNRRHFAEALRRSFAEARRYGKDLACMMIDLDNFKGINDRCGHHAGDEVLMFVASRIREELRVSDLAARYGGDEFVALLPHTDTAQAQMLATRIKQALSGASIDRVRGEHLGLSIGVASIADVPGDDPDALVRAADRALYDAKAHGKNTVVVHRVSA